MKHFYVCPTALLDSNPPAGEWQSIATPGLPQWSLVIVTHWRDHASQDVWEALPQVTEHAIWKWDRLVPPAVVTAFGPWGVIATDTIGDAMRKIRASWSAARH